jgi:hypothetical protein
MGMLWPLNRYIRDDPRRMAAVGGAHTSDCRDQARTAAAAADIRAATGKAAVEV